MKLAFVDFVFEEREAIRLEGFEIEVHPPLRTPAELVAAAAGTDVLLMRDQFGQVTAEVLAACPRLKLIVTRSAGYDHIDLEAARARGIVVCNVPDYGAHMIAEHAFGLMLAVARNICRGHERYRRLQRFDDTGLGGVELYGKTLGVIGTGRIGRHSIRIGQGFGMAILAYDVAPDEALAAMLGFHYRPLDEVLANADFITLHVPLIPDTRHLIDAEALARVKPGAILVNTSRGGVVDTLALKEALVAGRLRGAGLDVLEDERTAYHDFGQAHVVITPHLGWYTQEARDRILQISLQNVRAWMAGEPVNRVA
ncbi:MAG: NAD(P)-binding domain-containing protein [Anaerolineae bacterium]|nr:NAD(P)-binding domain-containing protein [Anaerolineae bacterium]